MCFRENSEDFSAAQNWSSGDEWLRVPLTCCDAEGINSVEAVVGRLSSVLASNVGHIIWTDRGYTSVSVMPVV